MARTTIFPTQEISYDFLFMDMVPAASIIPAPFALEPGQTYAVQWGDTLFENLSVIDLADAGFTGGAIGNGSGFELPGNDEPFAVAYFTDDTGGEIVVFFLDGNVSQTITVYQESAESPIVLKDRTGTGIEYEGVEGVRVFDKAGNAHVFVPPVETEEKTVELDFSGGAMEVTPTAGKVLSKVDIPVPENLLPENIAKDVDIAGVVGTHEGGGSGVGSMPYVMLYLTVYNGYAYGSSTALSTLSSSVTTFPTGSKILYEKSYVQYNSTTSRSSSASKSSSGPTHNEPNVSLGTITKTQDASGLKVTVTNKKYANKYSSYANVHVFCFAQGGAYCVAQPDGTMCMYADETCTGLLAYAKHIMGATKADLSRSSIVRISNYGFYYSDITEIIFPPTLEKVADYSLYQQNMKLLDFSKCTTVPTLEATTAIHAHTGLEIRVPSALYDEWIASANWSSYASYIVPV